MKIEWTEGDKGKDDRKFYMTTNYREPVTIFKICELLNLFAHNEWKIKNNEGWDTYGDEVK